MFLIDTDVAIHWRDGVADIIGRITASGDQVGIGLPTLIELENGSHAHRQLTRPRQAALTQLLRHVLVLPLDREVVAAYSAILASAGYARAQVFDRLIAATALVHDLRLVTMNGPDFRDIPGLNIEVWPAPAQ